MTWVLLLLSIVACASPEASRRRGGGPGADPGNHGESIEVRADRGPYRATPRLLPDAGRAKR